MHWGPLDEIVYPINAQTGYCRLSAKRFIPAYLTKEMGGLGLC